MINILGFPAKCVNSLDKIPKIPIWFFIRLWPFCVVLIYLTHKLPAWFLALTLYMCTSIHINFWHVYSFEQPLFWLHLFIYLYIYLFILSILTGKKHPRVKLQHFQKVWIWTFGLVHQINSIYEVPKLKQNKRKVVTGKTPFFVIGAFCTPHLS